MHTPWQQEFMKRDHKVYQILIVEKLQTAQQLTSTLLPSSSVNTMSSDEDKCFQCQELGHMAHYCPHIRCFDCNDYGHITADWPDKIPPSGIPARHRDNNSNTR